MTAASSPAEPFLSVQNLSITFGGVRAVDDLGFMVPRSTVVSLIGPNGAGKTTVLNSISGFVKAHGSVRFKGVELLRRGPHERASLGIGRTFQNLHLFGNSTLLENVLIGQHVSLGGNIVFDALHLPIRRREREARERGMSILAQLGLERYANRRAGELPFGVQSLAGLARALAVEPELVLLDEPGSGLNPTELSALGDIILRLREERGLTILLVEHNMRLVMGISDRVVVLDHGRKLADSPPAEVRQNRSVIEAYLGGSEDPSIIEEVQDELAESS